MQARTQCMEDIGRLNDEIATAEEAQLNGRGMEPGIRKLQYSIERDIQNIKMTLSTIAEAAMRENLEIYDRVGGGDSFASGLAYGFLTSGDPQQAVELGAAHGALAMTTPGDTSMATLSEVEKVASGGGARVVR